MVATAAPPRLASIHERHGKDEAERNAQAQASRGDSEGAERTRDNAADAERMDQWNNAHGRDCEERGIDCETCCLELARRGALLNRQTVTFVERSPALSRVGPFPCDVRRRKPKIWLPPLWHVMPIPIR